MNAVVALGCSDPTFQAEVESGCGQLGRSIDADTGVLEVDPHDAEAGTGGEAHDLGGARVAQAE